MFGRRGSCGCGGDDNFIWLILILIFCCGCDGGDDSCIWIISASAALRLRKRYEVLQ